MEKFYAVCYLYSFFILQNIILYMTPSGIPSISEEDEQEIIYDIPEIVKVDHGNDPSKPVIRRIGEFKLWFYNKEGFSIICNIFTYMYFF